MPALPGEAWTVGLDPLTDHGRPKVEVDNVTLAQARGLDLLGVYVVPVSLDLVGVRRGFPPDQSELDPGIYWTRAKEPPGVEIPPEDASEGDWNLVVGVDLQPGSDRGTAAGFEVSHSSDGRHYTYVKPNAIVAMSSCSDE